MKEIPIDWIKPSRLTSAKIGNLLLPTSKYDHAIIVCENDGKPIPVIISGEYRFHAMDWDSASRWSGALFEEFEIEVDLILESDGEQSLGGLGALVRQGENLYLSHRNPHIGFGGMKSLVRQGLPSGDDGLSQSFMSWRFVKWHHDRKVILWEWNDECPDERGI